MEDLNNPKRIHKISATNRKSCTIVGVNDVISFDLSEVVLETEQGMLTIKGDHLHVNRLSLDKGEVDIDGSLDSFIYSEVSEKISHRTESLFSRLFQ